jgi:hypothetical protein
MMIDDRIVVYRAGVFTSEPYPPWLIEIQRVADERRDWNAAVRGVLPHVTAHLVIGFDAYPLGELHADGTPDGGQYVQLSDGEAMFAEVWVPDPADWLPFSTTYIEPFMLTRATLHQSDKIDRLTTALIAFARHGEGRHIDRLTGESRIDQREDEDRSKLRASAKTLSTCK